MSSSAPVTISSSQNQQNSKKKRSITVLSILALAIAIIIALFLGYYSSSDPESTSTGSHRAANLFGLRRFVPASWSSSLSSVTRRPVGSAAGSGRELAATVAENIIPNSSTDKVRMKTPVYFLSHGGPSIMYDNDHPAYQQLTKIGREITTKVQPKAVVVFSAHWQAGADTVQVNTAEITDLIYDFYGFPSHYYKEKYPNVGSKEVATKVLNAFKDAGIKAEGVKRGLDHGVWASFKCAFEPESNPLNVPVVQVSLFNTEDPMQHYRLGEAVAKLREENILIVVSGMAVHNLRDMRLTWGDPRPLPYTASFDEALKDAVTTPPAERAREMAELLKRGDARQAHPSFEHLLPIHIGAGAAGEDLGKRLWTLKEGSMSWAQYRFGDVANASSSL